MKYALYDWAAPVGRSPAPPSLDEARTAFDAAMAAYERGDERAAAEGFTAAAQLLPEDAPPGIRDTILRDAELARRAAEEGSDA